MEGKSEDASANSLESNSPSEYSEEEDLEVSFEDLARDDLSFA